MNKLILNPEVQAYILNNIQEDISRILLGKNIFSGISSKEIVEQIEGKRRSEKKLPKWYLTPNIYYPPKISIEQASSEATAKYKSQLISGLNVVDLTGGFGVDSYYFSKIATHVTHCEYNKALSEIAKHNSNIFDTKNISFVNENSLQYLKNSLEVFDTIYVDPSRRVNTKKVFMLKDCEPDIVTNLDLLLSKAARIIVKTSPLLDIQSGLNELKNVKEIHIISLKNDCKELLWIIERDFTGEPEIFCSEIFGAHIQQYHFKPHEEKHFNLEEFSMPLEFIYEPNVALLKAGCFKLITRDFNILKLHQHSHLYTSNILNSEFIGRKFKLVKMWGYREFINEKPKLKANIICRNFPLPVEKVRIKHRIVDGGDEYLLFTTGPANQLLVLHCNRLD